jgi:lipoprotein-anchoring transpeptidase ErfK/SrfK
VSFSRALVVSLVASSIWLPGVSAKTAVSACTEDLGGAAVSGPGPTASWRAGLADRTVIFDRVPSDRGHRGRPLTSLAAPWLLVLQAPRAAGGRCFVRVRLPWRPNNVAGWVDARNVVVQKNRWRIEISTSRRTLTVYRSGRPVQMTRAVVGAPSTPTPDGLFAVTWADRGNPSDFLGSWVLELTGHSDALRRFEGGDATVGIHGRGGASLVDPLGSARSHGCVRISNASIARLVRMVGAGNLPGTPVRIS